MQSGGGSNKFNLRLSNLSLNVNTPTPPYNEVTAPTGESSSNHMNEHNIHAHEDAELINILPSYQMYQSTISKHITPSTEDLRSEPPRYELTPQSSQVSTGGSSDNEYFSMPGTGNSIPSTPDLPSSRRPFETAPQDDTVEGYTRWDDTILANSHKLKRLPSINKEVSKQINVKIHLTDQIGKVGEAPIKRDPLSIEFKQGDSIYGFVTVTNETETPIPFDMFAVVLEGATTFGDNHQSYTMNPPAHMFKFLSMFDFNASWNDGCLDRLSTDHNNPHFVYGNIIDPVDNTYTQLDHRKVFVPHQTYKKFFTFRLPEKLLDSSCGHGFVKHLQLPPTLGVSKNEVISNLRQKWKEGNYDAHSHSHHSHSNTHLHSTNHLHSNTHSHSNLTSPALTPCQSPTHSTLHSAHNSSDHLSSLAFKTDDLVKPELLKNKNKYASVTNDLAFSDASVSYSISARIIGKASDYESLFMKSPIPHVSPHSDEYVVANEDNCFLRCIFTTHSVFELNRPMINEEARLIYSNMVNKIEEKINLGRELSAIRSAERAANGADNGTSLAPSTSSHSLLPTSSTSELSKMQQSYYTKMRASHSHTDYRDHMFEVFLPYKKKSILGSSKVIGLAALSTPKVEYMISYMPLPAFQDPLGPKPDTKVTIPFDLTFIYTEGNHHTVPDFRKISVELVALTVKSKHLPIPVVFHHDMLFENKSRGVDNFDVVTIKKFQKYAAELSKVMKDVGVEALDMDRETFFDIKALANLASKYDHLKIPRVSVSAPHSTACVSYVNMIPWVTEKIRTTGSNGMLEEQEKYTKKFDLHLDINDAVLPGTLSDDFCLVPDFQSCMIARLYYLKVDLKCPNGEKLTMKVPLVLRRRREHSDEV